MRRPRQISVTFASVLVGSPASVWARVGTMDGVNAELLPLARMTFPQADRDLVTAFQNDRRGFDSWILLLGVLPSDRHRLRLRAVTPGEGFDERSTSWLHAAWGHRRTIAPGPEPGTCVLRDDVLCEPRLRAMVPLMEGVVAAVFRHRHRRLARAFADPSEGR